MSDEDKETHFILFFDSPNPCGKHFCTKAWKWKWWNNSQYHSTLVLY